MSYSWGASAARADGRHGRAALEAVPDAVPVLARDTRTIPSPDAQGTTAAAERQRVAVELAPMVEVWRRLLADHVPDGAGRCRTCTKGGTGLPSSPWPCSIHGIADMARRRHDADLDRSGRQDRLSS